jgi:hypothetical protein
MALVPELTVITQEIRPAWLARCSCCGIIAALLRAGAAALRRSRNPNQAQANPDGDPERLHLF